MTMETCSGEFRDEGKDGYENEAVMYLTEGEQKAQSPSLARHALASSEPEEIEHHIKVGSFYEVDHSKLSPKSPEQLYSIRVVMVSEKNSHGASLRFPSVHSLRTHFRDESYGDPDGKKLPALDEKYVMSSEMADQVLLRRIPPQEMAEHGHYWSFWSPPSLSTEKYGRDKASCLSKLRFSGMVQWGTRRQVRFLTRHEEFQGKVSVGSGLSGDLEKKKEVEREGDKEEEDLEDDEGEEEEEEEKEGVEEDINEEEKEEVGAVKNLRSSKRKLNVKNTTKAESSKRAKRYKEKQTVNTRTKKKSLMKNSIERWSTARYKLAEENMLKIMKETGAYFGNPILRPALRNEARKLIGDTGLLDHLLKHMAGKVAPGGADRFRRRHNSDGAMEYWIESADLMNIRKQAGVQDPYWTPPPGWKPGDNPTQDPASAKEIESLKREMAKMKKNIQELESQKEDEAAFLVRELKLVKEEMGKMKRNMEELASKKSENSSMVIRPDFTFSVECDDGNSLLLKKKKHFELMHRKSKIEEQLMEISECLSEMEEQTRTLKSGGTHLSESEAPPTQPLPFSIHSQSDNETTPIRQNTTTSTTKSVFVQPHDPPNHDQSVAAEDRAARIQRIKSGFRLCKPRGSFLWPNPNPNPNPTQVAFSQAAVNHNHDPLVVPTPPSASSTSAPRGSHRLSPVKPRPVRPTTLSLDASIPPPAKTPNSQHINVFNLNEAPIDLNPNEPAISSAEKEEAKEQKECSSSCSPRSDDRDWLAMAAQTTACYSSKRG